MAENATGSANRSEGTAGNGRLDSWKEIAAYLKRDVTTVRRWEKREGLPVHRHLHERRDSVYAYRAEIDEWWQSRPNQLAPNGALAGTSEESEGLRSPFRREPHARVAWILAATFFVVSLVLAARLAIVSQRTGEQQLRFPVFPPAQTGFGSVSLSPDGRQLAVSGIGTDGTTRLWIQPLGTQEAWALPETDGATLPFWSPTGDAVGFFAAGKLWVVHISGDNLRSLAAAPQGRGGSWNRDGVIVFAPTRDGPLYSVPATGGVPGQVTTVDPATERGHLWPEFLPDGKHFIYLADSSEPEHHHLFAGALSTGERWRLLSLASSAVYSRDGYLLFARDRKLMAQPFDVARLATTGEPLPLAEHVVQQWSLDHKTDVSVSDTGRLIFRSMGGFDTQLVWRDRAEQEQSSLLVVAAAGYSEPTFSPDKSRIAVDIFDHRPSKRFGFGVTNITSDIWMVDRASGALAQFTSDPAADFGPVWSPDGRSVVFSSNRSGSLNLYQRNASGTGPDQLLRSSPDAKYAESWSPDGRFLVYSALDPKTRFDIWLLPMADERTPVPLVRTDASESQVQISPNGRWFSYTSSQKGRSVVYVQAFPTPGERWQISTEGGGDARWNGDGTELFYIAEDRRLMAVAVTTGATFAHGTPVALFDTGMQPDWGTSRNHYDVSADGRRFLFMVPVADDRSSPFTMVLNWAAGLRK